jgi:hypothetical protein
VNAAAARATLASLLAGGSLERVPVTDAIAIGGQLIKALTPAVDKILREPR